LGARDWKAVVDWQLMGHEHVSMPDAEFAALCTRVKGLQDKWRPMVSYLYSLGLRERELTRLVAKESQIFVGNVGRARSRVAFLQSSFAMTQAELVRILEVAPRVLFLRVERTLAKRLAFLESLAIPREKLGHVVSRMPTLLYTTVDTLEPRVQYLDFVLKMTRAEVGRMVLRHPNVLTCNEGMLESRLLFLFTLGLGDEQVKRMVMSHPQLLQYTPDNMAPRVTWLLQEVGMTPEEVVHTVTRLSQLFSLSVDNSLRPKYRYLCRELCGTKAMLLQSPTFLSLSLAARIMPRHRFMLKKGHAPPYSMWDFTSADPNFARSMDVPLEEWLAFREAFVTEHEAAAAAAADEKARAEEEAAARARPAPAAAAVAAR
jgi:mTERF domain-containing protein